MSVKDYYKVLQIIDALTGEVIETIKIRNYTKDTISNMVNDLINIDINQKHHGLLIKEAINP